MRTFTAAVVIFVALSGCTKSDAITEEEQAQALGLVVDVPIWNLGDYWTYDTTGGPVTYVVSGMEGGDYITDITSDSMALYHAGEEISTIGAIRKSDLAGSQGTDRVQMFKFPLEHNMTWTTMWDQEPRSIVAHAMGEGNFHLMAKADGVDREIYKYSNQTRWFDDLRFYDENGTETWYMELTESGSNWQGEYVRYTLHDVQHFMQKDVGATREVFTADASWTELVITGAWDCAGPGESLAGVHLPEEHPAGQPAPPVPTVNEPYWGHQESCPGSGSDSAILESVEGDWYVDLALASQTGYTIIVFEPRTLERIAFPAA